MSESEAARIQADLSKHAGLFQLDQGGLGEEALDIAVDGLTRNFDEQLDPDGIGWRVLSTDYSRWKTANYPGEPMGVLTGLMRSELDGERAIARDSASWTCGTTEAGRTLATWFQDPEGDNQPARKFADLTTEAIVNSDHLFDKHFEEGTR